MMQGILADGVVEGSNVDFAVFDPRCEEMGLRIYANKANSTKIFDPKDVLKTSDKMYDALRYVMMIPEGDECKDAVPAKMNFDLLGSIDLQKGCFLGQELTARAYYTGIVRKRPYFVITHPTEFPINPASDQIGLSLLDEAFTVDLKGKVIKDSKGRNVLTIMGKH